MEFYDGPTLRRNIEQRDEANIPAELKGYRNEKYFPKSADYVLARVDLGNISTSDAPELARKQALAVLLAASLHSGGKGKAWRDTGSHIHAMNESIVSETFSRRPDTPMPTFDLDPLAFGIDEVLPKISSHLPLVDQSLDELLQALDIWDRAKRLDGASAVLLNVRIIELVCSYDSGIDWVTFCRRFRPAWILNEMLWSLRKGFDEADALSALLSNGSQDRVQQIINSVSKSEKGMVYCDTEVGLALLDQLAAEFTSGDITGYRVNALARQFSTHYQLGEYRRVLNGRWCRALNRLERVRNAITHGGPVTEQVLASVSPFSRKLAGRVLGYSLGAIFEGRDIPQAMNEVHTRGIAWEKEALTASSASEFLFGRG
ncbi:hypothetical protein [Streptomyces sp. NPDC021622]|uniref:hypothetical protein n=1 Tax=Streptomyces sp. NPDC021622 TaxID=3155013 RepID=UPI0033C2C369